MNDRSAPRGASTSSVPKPETSLQLNCPRGNELRGACVAMGRCRLATASESSGVE